MTTEKEHISGKIRQVIAGADQFKEDQFRLVLEGLVKKGGKEAELELVKYITMGELSVETRGKVIHAVGYIQNPLYLVPLKKVIDQAPNIHLKKAAVIAISRFNNRQALNILNHALQTIQIPYLQNTINEQIDFLKKNNPLLALLPRFLKGDKDKKSFLVALDILKKTLKPTEVPVFTNYLKSDSPAIRQGAFEILCCIGDRTLQAPIFEFFYRWVHQVEGNESVALLENFKQYILRFPSFVFTQISKLQSLYKEIQDARSRKELISIFCHLRAPDALSFIKDVYNQSDPELREFIIEESVENEQVVEFLFEKYRTGQVLKENILGKLLNTQKGFTYFVHHFSSFNEKHRQIIIDSLPEELPPDRVHFIKKLFQSDLCHFKTFLIKRVREYYIFSLKETLFDPAREEEFMPMGNDYLDTITAWFPISSVRKLLEMAVQEGVQVPRIKEYFHRVIEIVEQEVAITLRDSHLLPALVQKVIGACNLELNQLFLQILSLLKSLDIATYKNLYDALNLFINQRGGHLVEEESLAIKKVKGNFHNLMIDIKTIETLEKEIKAILLRQIPDLVQLKKVLVSYHLGAAFKIKFLIRSMTGLFKTMEENDIGNWKLFVKEFPLIMRMAREAKTMISQQGDDYWHSFWDAGIKGEKAGKSFHSQLRIVIHFEEKKIAAFFKDQLEEVIPHFTIVLREPRLEPTDILLCDSYALSDYIKQNTLSTNRVFVLLENRKEFSNYKALNPRAFFKPVAFHRVLKLILQELYLLRS